jgi:hypothetical protein
MSEAQVAALRQQLATQRAQIVELVSTHKRREETLTTMLQEMTEVSGAILGGTGTKVANPAPFAMLQVVKHEIERADRAHVELERLRKSSHGAVAVPSQRISAAESRAPSPSPASLSASNDVLPAPPPPATSVQPTRNTRYARALLKRASHQKGHAASSANVAAAKEHFAAAKLASATSDYELACTPLKIPCP